MALHGPDDMDTTTAPTERDTVQPANTATPDEQDTAQPATDDTEAREAEARRQAQIEADNQRTFQEFIHHRLDTREQLGSKINELESRLAELEEARGEPLTTEERERFDETRSRFEESSAKVDEQLGLVIALAEENPDILQMKGEQLRAAVNEARDNGVQPVDFDRSLNAQQIADHLEAGTPVPRAPTPSTPAPAVDETPAVDTAAFKDAELQYGSGYNTGTRDGKGTADASEREATSKMQEALESLGYDTGSKNPETGKFDGYLGPKTLAAINAFEEAEGITPPSTMDGQPLNPETLKKLAEKIEGRGQEPEQERQADEPEQAPDEPAASPHPETETVKIDMDSGDFAASVDDQLKSAAERAGIGDVDGFVASVKEAAGIDGVATGENIAKIEGGVEVDVDQFQPPHQNNITENGIEVTRR